MCLRLMFWPFRPVALRKESVDRKSYCSGGTHNACQVALRKESVDRKMTSKKVLKSIDSRSPQGERG